MIKELKIGLIATFLIALLVWGVNFLKGKNIFSQTNHYYAIYDGIGGLEKASPIFLNGLNVGTIESIKLYGDNNRDIIVYFSIRKDIKIPKASEVVIFSSDFLGTKAVRLDFTNKKQYYQSGDTLPSNIEVDLTEQIYSEIKPIKEKSERMIETIDSLTMMLKNATQTNISKSLTNLKDITQNLKRSSSTLDNLLTSEKDNLKSVIRNTKDISENLKNNNENISNTLSNMSSITDSLRQANLQKTLNKLENTLTKTDSILYRINRGEGSLGLLVNNDSLYNNLNSTSRDLDLLINDLKENPGRYINISIFGGKKKDK